MIRMQSIEKHFDSGAGRTYVLRRINLDIREGEFITIMGPSGAGKSTLLGILGMLDSEWSGEFQFLGQEVHKLNRKKRADLNKQYIGFVFQSYHLLDSLTVYENLDLPLSYKNVRGADRASTVCHTPRSLSHRRQKGPLPEPAVGWTAAAGGGGAGGDLKSEAAARRRADRQPALGPGRGDHATVQTTQRRGDDDRAGHPL